MKYREISAQDITSKVAKLIIEANTAIGEDVIEAIKSSYEDEESPIARDILQQLIENAQIAKQEGLALCQDTGLAVIFIELGQNVHISGGDLNEAINEGVREGYRNGYFRASSVDPITRENFGDNTPAIIHIEIVSGDKLKLMVAPKGFGSENMSRVELFPPAVGIEGAKNFVIKRVEEAGANPCPPIIVGVGIGGNLEKSAFIAKKSLFRPLGQRHPDCKVAMLEDELLTEINKLGIGPQGMGGRTTALDVHIETYPTHIGSMPVAVNLQCHSHRHKEALL